MLVNMQLFLSADLKTPYRDGNDWNHVITKAVKTDFGQCWLVQHTGELHNVTHSVWQPEYHTHVLLDSSAGMNVLLGKEKSLPLSTDAPRLGGAWHLTELFGNWAVCSFYLVWHELSGLLLSVHLRWEYVTSDSWVKLQQMKWQRITQGKYGKLQ